MKCNFCKRDFSYLPHRYKEEGCKSVPICCMCVAEKCYVATTGDVPKQEPMCLRPNESEKRI